MQHGQIHGPLDVELESTRLNRPFDNRSQLQGFPQTAKDQIGPDPLHLDRLGLTGGMRIDKRQLFAEAQAGAHQGIQLPCSLEYVEAADGAQHTLMHLAVLAKAFDDLEVGISASAFDAKIHRAVLFLYLYPALARWAQSKTAEPHQNLPLHFEFHPARRTENPGKPRQVFSDSFLTVEDGSNWPTTHSLMNDWNSEVKGSPV